MKVQVITYTKRVNTGNYTHEEYSAEASLEDGENALLAFLELKKQIQNAIEVNVDDIKAIVTEPAPVAEEVVAETPAVVEEAKEKKTRKPRTTKVEEPTPEVEPVLEVASARGVETTPPVETAVVKYDRTIEAHKQLLSSYLSNNFPAWKTVAGVKEFSGSLVGKPYLDIDGQICDSFKACLYDFFS